MAFGLADLGDVRSKDSRPSTWRLSFCAWTERPPQPPLLGRIFDSPATALNLWLGAGKIGPAPPLPSRGRFQSGFG